MKTDRYNLLTLSLLISLFLFSPKESKAFSLSSIHIGFSWSLIAVVIGLILLIVSIVLFITNKKKEGEGEKKVPSYYGGSSAADKPTVGYKHPCRYCNGLIPPDSNICPFCNKENPLGPLRCPRCHNPIQKDWQSCSHCGLNLRINCPFCSSPTIFSDYCENCQKRLLVVCPHCQFEQPPIGDNCVKCGQSLDQSKN